MVFLKTDDPAQGFKRFVVHSVVGMAEGVKTIRFEPVDQGRVAEWNPGAHIEVRLATGVIRQYSLCGDRSDVDGYTVGVLLEPAGRGGSIAMHQLAKGDTVEVRGPRNNFELVPASRYLFLAGGIGITPIISMIRHVAESGVPWRLVYGARNDSAIAFRSELASCQGGVVRVLAEDTDGRIDLEQELSEIDSSVAIYSCGPAPMLDALADVCSALGIESRLHVERFTASADALPVHEPTDSAFVVELARTGTVVTVERDQTIVDAVLHERPELPYSCLEGYCGSCETSVLDGVPEHRDEYLSDEDRTTNATMLICVGRAKTHRLVLDL